jgi:hypothetical protein
MLLMSLMFLTGTVITVTSKIEGWVIKPSQSPLKIIPSNNGL